MKMSQALEMIENSKQKKGFMVTFDKREGHTLRADYFPDKLNGEKLIETEEEAWKLAQDFMNSTGDEYVNIYVIDSSFGPVSDYNKKMLRKR